MDAGWMAARWDKGGEDYINCLLDKEQYQAFVQALVDAEKTEFKDWEKNTPYFEGCVPIEVMAERDQRLCATAHESGGPRQPSHRTLALSGGTAASGKQARTLVNTGRLTNQLKHGEQVRFFGV